MDKEPIHVHPHEKLDGRKYGVRLKNKKNDIYVSPAVFSLFQSEDPQLISDGTSLLFKSLRIKTITEDDEANPFKS